MHNINTYRSNYNYYCIKYNIFYVYIFHSSIFYINNKKSPSKKPGPLYINSINHLTPPQAVRTPAAHLPKKEHLSLSSDDQ